MYGLGIGLIIGLLAYFSGGPVEALTYASLFWLTWYGLWQTVSGCMSLVTALGISGGGAVVGGFAGGMLGSFLGSLLGGSISLLILVHWSIKTVLLVGGAYYIFSGASNLTDIADLNFIRAGGGGLMMLLGVFIRSGSSGSNRDSLSSSSSY